MPQDHRQLVIVDGLLPPRRDIHLVEANKNEQQQPLKLRALAASGTEPPPSHNILVSSVLSPSGRSSLTTPARYPIDIQLGGRSFTP